MKMTLMTAPATDAVSVADMREHSRIKSRREDAMLKRLLGGAQRAAEGYLRRKLVTQTWQQYFDAFDDPLELRYPPLSSVSETGVKYLDTDGDAQTLATTVWETGEVNGVGVVRRKHDQVWPSTRGHADVVWVEFVCGYGDSVDVLEPIKSAIRIHAAHFFRHREGDETPSTFFDLLRPYRSFQFVKTHA